MSNPSRSDSISESQEARSDEVEYSSSDAESDTEFEVQPLTSKDRKLALWKEKKRQNRREHAYKRQKEQRVQEALSVIGEGSSKHVAVIKLQRRPELAREMEGKRFDHTDPIFDDFKRIGGKGSGTVVVLDEDTDEDMTQEDLDTFNYVFTYFRKDQRLHLPVKNNHAMIKGQMTAIGWRVCMETGQAVGTYAPSPAGKKHIEAWLEHRKGAIEVHRIYANSFCNLAPNMYRSQVQQRAKLGVPALGVDYENNNLPFLFCSNLAYTHNDFENLGHLDNDVSTFTHGMGGNVDKATGRLASFEDGFRMEGAFFYVADYGLLIEYDKIDGVVEQVWQGSKHVYGTVGGKVKEGFTRYGSSAQINQRLTAKVAKYQVDGEGIIVDDQEYAARYGKRS
ncbi:hypothetical protein FN846DRAFT_1005876 [Sphaerosporella brunnea]|uniref:Tet-like 2OG-Fe(II) oxygenase domain-containing protein n=1 Tax=Sphaerosporella brunnea TaxID=1250544 RepID=A0A5J5ECJ2_9PEZI|nr:hypothetical protein FN846DRAFT_1005876 [Sphaerosporella brunnea]